MIGLNRGWGVSRSLLSPEWNAEGWRRRNMCENTLNEVYLREGWLDFRCVNSFMRAAFGVFSLPSVYFSLCSYFRDVCERPLCIESSKFRADPIAPVLRYFTVRKIFRRLLIVVVLIEKSSRVGSFSSRSVREKVISPRWKILFFDFSFSSGKLRRKRRAALVDSLSSVCCSNQIAKELRRAECESSTLRRRGEEENIGDWTNERKQERRQTSDCHFFFADESTLELEKEKSWHWPISYSIVSPSNCPRLGWTFLRL